MIILLNWLDTHICLVAKAAWSNSNINSTSWGRYGNTSQSITHTACQYLIDFVHVSLQRFYIPFILRLFNYIQNNDELMCFELIWFFWKKALDSINHLIYTHDMLHIYNIYLPNAIHVVRFRNQMSLCHTQWGTKYSTTTKTLGGEVEVTSVEGVLLKPVVGMSMQYIITKCWLLIGWYHIGFI